VAEESTKGHGRLAHYRLQATSRLTGHLDWPGQKQVCRLTRRVLRQGEETIETAYAVTSVSGNEAGTAQLLHWWRNHWHIENRLHWVRDTIFGEDDDRVRHPGAGQVLAAFRNAAINILRLAQVTNIAAAMRENAYRVDHLFAKLGIMKK
jgi:hypothetical protein